MKFRKFRIAHFFWRPRDHGDGDPRFARVLARSVARDPAPAELGRAGQRRGRAVQPGRCAMKRYPIPISALRGELRVPDKERR